VTIGKQTKQGKSSILPPKPVTPMDPARKATATNHAVKEHAIANCKLKYLVTTFDKMYQNK
jgi:hypothetical protein